MCFLCSNENKLWICIILLATWAYLNELQHTPNYSQILTRWQCRGREAHAKPAKVPHVQRAKEQLKRTVRAISRKILNPARPSRAADDHNGDDDDDNEDERHPKPNHCNGLAHSEVPRPKLCVTWSMTNCQNVQCKNFTQRTWSYEWNLKDCLRGRERGIEKERET